MLESKLRFIPEMIANIFFIRKTRGNGLSKKCSSWEYRPDLRILSPQVEHLASTLLEKYRTQGEMIFKIQQQKGNTITGTFTAVNLTAGDIEMMNAILHAKTREAQ